MALLARILALLVVTVATVAIKVVPLDMAMDSFDDQYRGCGPAMTKTLPALYKFEFQKNPLFAKTWVKAEAEWRKRGSHVSPLASLGQAVAVMTYTMKYLYKEFNAAVHVAGEDVYLCPLHGAVGKGKACSSGGMSVGRPGPGGARDIE
uniref:NAD(P)(+)--arginine ADP-ribosyltransferase n=1 Tax=Zonotrichia albicollis TaxID=44394 RepID=A0A8D2M1A2_ZONAL